MALIGINVLGRVDEMRLQFVQTVLWYPPEPKDLICSLRRAAAVSGQGLWCPVLSCLSPQIPQ